MIGLVISSTSHFLTDNSLQAADKDKQEMRALTEKPHDAIVKFDMLSKLQRHRAVLPAIARLLLCNVYINILVIKTTYFHVLFTCNYFDTFYLDYFPTHAASILHRKRFPPALD